LWPESGRFAWFVHRPGKHGASELLDGFLSRLGGSLPVKFQRGLKYGTGTAHLAKHTPPRAATTPQAAGEIPNFKIPNPK
jgi:hypothetical protein